MHRYSVPVHTVTLPTPFLVGPVNTYVIRRDPITLIDTGPLTDDAWDVLRAGLRNIRLSVHDIERVLFTHGHQDHFGQAYRIADVSGASFHGARFDQKNFLMKRQTRRLLDKMSRAGFGAFERFVVVTAVTAVDTFAQPFDSIEELNGGEVLSGEDYFIRVLSTPGHTPGCLCYEIVHDGILFTGDTVLRDITPNAIVDEDPRRPGQTFRSLSVYLESLDQLEKDYAEITMLTGHGRPVTDFPARRQEVARLYQNRSEDLIKALSGSPRTVRELVFDLFPAVQTINLYLAFSEVMGFLMYLEDQGRVEQFAERHVDRYRLTPRA